MNTREETYPMTDEEIARLIVAGRLIEESIDHTYLVCVFTILSTLFYYK